MGPLQEPVMRSATTILRVLVSIGAAALAQWVSVGKSVPVSLDDPSRLTAHEVTLSKVNHEGRAALQVLDASPQATSDYGRIALIPDVVFADGALEVDVAAEVTPIAAPDARGFAGIAFRASDDGRQFEYFYLRATNGRADDQVRRNHALQYASFPDFPWN